MQPISNSDIYVSECQRLHVRPNSLVLRQLDTRPGVHSLLTLSLRDNHVGQVLPLLDLVAANTRLSVLCLAGSGIRQSGLEMLVEVCWGWGKGGGVPGLGQGGRGNA